MGWFNHQLVPVFQIEIDMEIGPFEDVFPIESGDIPASYVSLQEVTIFPNFQ